MRRRRIPRLESFLEDFEDMLKGLEPGTMPPAYTGGMTLEGVWNLYDFVEAGGTLVAMDNASELPLTTFGLPVRDVTQGLRESEFYVPGSILRVRLDPTHPVAYGMPRDAGGFFVHSAAFAVGRAPSRWEQWTATRPAAPDAITVVGSYASSDLLMSGWVMGERVIAGRSAILHARVGRGQVVLLGFRVQHRGQPHGTFKLLLNSLFLGAYAGTTSQ